MNRLAAVLIYIGAMTSSGLLVAWGLHEVILAQSADGEHAADFRYVLSPLVLIGLVAISATLIHWRPRSPLTLVLVGVAWAAVYLRLATTSTWAVAAVGGSTWRTHELLMAYAFPAPFFWIVGLCGLIFVCCLNLWYRNKVIAHAG